jgi:hypothetical protein
VARRSTRRFDITGGSASFYRGEIVATLWRQSAPAIPGHAEFATFTASGTALFGHSLSQLFQSAE